MAPKSSQQLPHPKIDTLRDTYEKNCTKVDDEDMRVTTTDAGPGGDGHEVDRCEANLRIGQLGTQSPSNHLKRKRMLS